MTQSYPSVFPSKLGIYILAKSNYNKEKDVVEADGAWIISKTNEPAFFHELEMKMGLGKSGSVWDFLDSVRLSLSNASKE